MKNTFSRLIIFIVLLGGILLFVFFNMTAAKEGELFDDISGDRAVGIDYERVRSVTFSEVEEVRRNSRRDPVVMEEDVPNLPAMPHGLPGVALFDYDRDGDLDIYVTNGPGAANSLYASQLTESGEVTFVDVAEPAGVAAAAQDSFGVCYGDTDNDGDHDLLVLGRSEANLFFVNDGNGTFSEAAGSGLAGGNRSSSSCSMGDVNGDGLLDIVVGNSFDMQDMIAIFMEPFALNEHNQLFLNEGDNRFADVSAEAGLESMAGFPAGAEDAAGITWATAMVDADLDGDLDVLFADDQGGHPAAAYGGVDRGFIHLLVNDGSGHFEDKPLIVDETAAGSWMGLSFGDFNCDGHMDVFGSNFGDYNLPTLEMPYAAGEQETRWFLGQGNNEFTDPGPGSLNASVFGWGSAVFDYDNDGDSDILYHGSLDMILMILADNPGVLLENDGCSANFRWVEGAMTTAHERRNVHGVAIGDLNQDGRTDVVTAANLEIPRWLPMMESPAGYDSVFDKAGRFAPLFIPTERGMIWTGLEPNPGTLSVELNRTDNGNGSVAVTPLGSVNVVENGVVNRDGIGAVFFFTPAGGQTVMMPVQGGSSHLSQHSLETIFGLGASESGTLEVLWPGGVRNRLYDVAAGERLTIPEIPCSFTAEWDSAADYESCVEQALEALVAAGVLSADEQVRFLDSALQAYEQSTINN